MPLVLPSRWCTCLGLPLVIGGLVCGSMSEMAAAATAAPSSTLQQLLSESRYHEAAALARTSIAEAEARYGEDSIEEAELLDALVQALYRGGQAMDPEAFEAIQRAIAIKKSLFGHVSRPMATSLMQLGNLYIYRGNDEKALENCLDAVDILENLLTTSEDPVQRDLAVVLSNIGIIYRRRGQVDDALEVCNRALALRKSTLGPDHPDLAASYNNLANLFVDLGRYEEARSNDERSLEIRELNFGPDHELVAESLNNLATVLGYMGHYDEALAAQERALRVITNTLGDDNERTWTVGFNLAVLESEMGDYVGAQKLYEEVLAKYRRRFGDRSVESVEAQDALAEALRAQGQLEAARDLYESSVSIYEEAYGEGTRSADFTLQGLGKVLTELGEDDRGREVLTRSLAIRESYGDLESPQLCDVLHALAELELASAHYDEAIRYATRSRAIIEKRLGSSHPMMAEAQSILARAEYGRGDIAAAFDDALLAETTSRQHLRETIGVLSECLALDYAANRVNGLDLALSLLDSSSAEEQIIRAWDQVIRSRGLVLEEMAQRRRATRGVDDPQLASLLRQSRAARERLANLSLRGPGWEDITTYKAMLDQARGEAERLDRAIALQSEGQRPPRSQIEVGWEEVRARLRPKQTLVSFVRSGQGEGSGSYRAFVVRGDGSAPRTVPLGDADTMDQLVSAWRDQMEVAPTTRTRGFSRIPRDASAEYESYMEVAKQLRRRAWDPLIEGLGEGTRTVFIVPDGTLHLVNFGALVDEADRFLIEAPQRLWLLSTERSLAQVHPDASTAGGVLVIGGPDYAADPAAPTRVDASALAELEIGTPEISQPVAPVEVRAPRPGCLDSAALHFEALPGAQREAEDVAAFWSSHYEGTGKVVLLKGAEAREEALKQAFARPGSHPSVLHIATHGFFVSDDCAQADMRRTNPLVLSGLAFAGADHWRNADSGEDDGLLTAEEFAGMDLEGLDLAVLSSCGTGLGELRARGEGIFGLRRALQIAGARTVMMSLWSVGDDAGYRFMNRFYRARFEDGRSMEEALRSTSLTLLQQARAGGTSPHPRDWAAFVAVGDWR